MSHAADLTRRRILAVSGGAVAAGALGALLPDLAAHAQVKPVTVGFIYVGPRNDYGWNQAHAAR